MEGITWTEAIYGLAIIILSAFIAWEKIKEKRITKILNLKENPERCAVHETKIRKIEEEFGELRNENKQDHEKIFHYLEELRERMARVEAKQNGYSKGAT